MNVITARNSAGTPCSNAAQRAIARTSISSNSVGVWCLTAFPHYTGTVPEKDALSWWHQRSRSDAAASGGSWRMQRRISVAASGSRAWRELRQAGSVSGFAAYNVWMFAARGA